MARAFGFEPKGREFDPRKRLFWGYDRLNYLVKAALLCGIFVRGKRSARAASRTRVYQSLPHRVPYCGVLVSSLRIY